MIGYLQYNAHEDMKVRLLSLFAYAKKVPFCHFSFSDIDSCINGGLLKAKRWNGSCYEEFETEFPAYVDKASGLFNPKTISRFGEERVKYVREHAKVLVQKSLTKDQLMLVMMKEGFGSYAIPSFPVSSFNEVAQLMKTVAPALIKPAKGRQGLFVYKLERTDSGEIYAYDPSGRQIFDAAFWDRYFSAVSEQFTDEIIFQPFLDFRYDDNHVLDFRLLRMRSEDGSWKDAATFGRIGSNAITSNFHTGGSMIEADMALRAIAPDKADALLDEIMMLGEKLPLIIEKIFGDDCFCIGFDIAVDRTTMHPYVIESNLTPGQRFIHYQFADHRVDFYKYLLSKKE